MAKPTFPYKPELGEEKARLFARCFMHCLSCQDFALDQIEQAHLVKFCAIVESKTFVEDALEKLNNPEPQPMSEESFKAMMEQAERSKNETN